MGLFSRKPAQAARPGDPIPAAVNGTTQLVHDYAPDPRGLAYGATLTGAEVALIDGCAGHVYEGDRGSAEHSFNGYWQGRPLQGFQGAAALGMYGDAKPTVGGSPQLDASIALDGLNDTALKIFAARAQRQMAR